jgi:hypothetical protein
MLPLNMSLSEILTLASNSNLQILRLKYEAFLHLSIYEVHSVINQTVMFMTQMHIISKLCMVIKHYTHYQNFAYYYH